MQLDDRALMELDAEILFTYDVRGRMLRVNEPDGRRAPRLFVGRTSGGHVVRFGELVPNVVVDRLLAIVEAQSPADGLRLPPALRESLRATLERDGPIGSEGGGPAYRFPETVTPSGDAIEVTDANRERVRDALPWLYRELGGRGPCQAVLVNGRAVSVCFSSRIGARAMEAGVFTLPEFRGRGYAARVTAAWALAVRRAGIVPVYSTSWENLASQGVARSLGLVAFGGTASWT
jgi:GNAT superfamily N-acetyltransferase